MVYSVGGALQYQHRSGRDPRDTARAVGQMMEAASTVALTIVKYHGDRKPAEMTIKNTEARKPSEPPKPSGPATAPIIAAPYKPPIQKK